MKKSRSTYLCGSVQTKLQQPNNKSDMAAKTDLFQSPDYFGVDELLTEEHKLIRETVRQYVKRDFSHH